jgi:hypothetical protein
LSSAVVTAFAGGLGFLGILTPVRHDMPQTQKS